MNENKKCDHLFYCVHCGEEGHRAPEWVSVEERLPEERDWYAVWVPYEDDILDITGSGGDWYKLLWNEKARCFESLTHSFPDATHWMPLPPSPSDGESK